jgi:hypothetical protein
MLWAFRPSKFWPRAPRAVPAAQSADIVPHPRSSTRLKNSRCATSPATPAPCPAAATPGNPDAARARLRITLLRAFPSRRPNTHRVTPAPFGPRCLNRSAASRRRAKASCRGRCRSPGRPAGPRCTRGGGCRDTDVTRRPERDLGQAEGQAQHVRRRHVHGLFTARLPPSKERATIAITHRHF